MTFALVRNDAVFELFPADPDLGPAFDVRDVSAVAGVAQGWIVAGATFAPPPAAPAPTLAQAQADQVQALHAACAAAITTGGFASSALGTVHGYPSDAVSQTNLLGSVTDSLLPNLPANWTTPFWCADTSEAWSFAPHTAAQIQQVGQDGKAAVVAAQQKLATLSAQVAAATTVAAVQAIAWS